MKNYKPPKICKTISISDVMVSSLLNEKEILRSPINSNQISSGWNRNNEDQRWRNYDSLRRRNAVVGKCGRTENAREIYTNNGQVSIERSQSEILDYSSNTNFASSPIESMEKAFDTELNFDNVSATDLSDVMEYGHWSEWIPEEIVHSLNREEMKSQEAIWEFIANESKFISNLKVVQNIFLPQLNLLKKHNQIDDILPQNIFGGINEIYEAHLTFWKACPGKCLNEAVTEKKLLSGEKIVEYFPDNFNENFEEYLSHCLFAPKYQEQLINNETNLGFKEYLKWCQNHKYSVNRVGLGDFLLQPMQHMMRYAMLINAIRSHCLCAETKVKLEKIIEKVQAFLTEIDSKLREQEEMEIIQQINNKLERPSCIEQYSHEEKFISKFYKFDLLAPMPSLPFSMARILLKYSTLKMRDLSNRLFTGLRNTFGQETMMGFSTVNIYLFTDIILIARATKRNTISLLKHPMLLDTVSLEKRSQDQFFIISQSEFNLPTQMLCFKSSNPKVIDSWMEAIKSVSDEFISAKKDFVSAKYFRQHMVEIKRRNFSSMEDDSAENSPVESRKNSTSEPNMVDYNENEINKESILNQHYDSKPNPVEKYKVGNKSDEEKVQITQKNGGEEKWNMKKKKSTKSKLNSNAGIWIFPPGHFRLV